MSVSSSFDTLFLSQRREAISRDASQIGIDYVNVADGITPMQRTLHLSFIPSADPEKSARPSPTPQPDQVIIEGVLPLPGKDIEVLAVTNGAAETVLDVTIGIGTSRVPEIGGSPIYRLNLRDIAPLDPFFSSVTFSLTTDLSGERGPGAPPAGTAPTLAPEINYLARDYASFRQLMLDRLSLTIPTWHENNPADMGITIVELLAYVADQLSYFQDAVATEAYLGTARKRISVHRHARLLDYVMHEGCNARVWAHFAVGPGGYNSQQCLPQGTALVTGRWGPTAQLDFQQYEEAIGQGATAFETLSPLPLLHAHNVIQFYTWGEPELSLPRGATRATLLDPTVDGIRQLDLHVGDVLIFEQVQGTPPDVPVDPTHRQAVRLTAIRQTEDPLGGQFGIVLSRADTDAISIVEITWAEEDALTLPFPIATVEGDVIRTGLSVALGNIVLADQGWTIRDEHLPLLPADRHTEVRLQERDLTFCHGAEDAAVGPRPASLAVFQDPHTALPAITLTADGATWIPRLDLLDSIWDSRAFVVEMESDRAAWLRFGDGVLGEKPRPGTEFHATYRVGNGITGNVGSDTIASFFVPGSSGFFPDMRVRNPLPAQGGIDPEPMEQVRLDAPQAIYRQERCVTETDYAAFAERHPDVRQARASRQWTGSWGTIFLSINRRGGRPVDAAFQREMSAFIRPAMLTGADIIVLPPRFVPLEIALTAHIGAGYLPGVIRQALLETFGTGTLPDGRQAFFHPDNFSFGQSVYLSQVIAQAMRVHGVRWVTVDRFRRWHATDQGELTQGEIAIGPTEIARLDNDPNAPEWGQITFAIVPQRTDDDASVA